MSRYDSKALYDFLPDVYRRRDAEQGYPLREFVEILAQQAEVLERDIARLYDNQFIETCDPWVIPYIGDLIGLRSIPILEGGRAEVANMIGYRRRKGTAAVLEQLARDVTGWSARVVEFFDLLPTTQYMNHLRLHRPRTPDLRDASALEHVNGPFETAGHTVDVRSVVTRRGRYNIPNLGLFLFRIQAFPLQLIEPEPFGDPDDGHYTFSTLGNNAPLFNHPVTETGPAHIAEEINVPVPIRARALHADLEENRSEYYGGGRSIAIFVPTLTGWTVLEGFNIVACDLTDFTRPLPPGSVSIDPVRGRLAWSEPDNRPELFRVSFYNGFSMAIGGGQYERASSLEGDVTAVVGHPNDPLVQQAQLLLPAGVGVFSTLADALVDAQVAWNPGESRVIEILDSWTYRDALPPVTIPENSRLSIRAANEQRPTLRLPGEFSVTGGHGSTFELNGLLIGDNGVRMTGLLNQAMIHHCTLVPGLTLDSNGLPGTSGAVSLIIESHTTEAHIHSSILGGLRVASESTLLITDSILDAHDRETVVYGGINTDEFGGPLTCRRTTMIGEVSTAALTLGENAIFLGVVTAERRQQGCVRFSWVPRGSRVPRRFRCQPDIPQGASELEARRVESRLAPQFTSLRYGDPGYCQLDWRGAKEIMRGADNESEMGVFSSLMQPQREAGFRVRLDEFLPVGLEAGIIFVS